MARATRLLLSCAGPYNVFGMPVVEACVEAGTHYVDITGEPLFMERCYVELHKKAVANKVSVVNSCGFDCVPTDISIAEIRKKVPDAATIDCVLTVKGQGVTFFVFLACCFSRLVS